MDKGERIETIKAIAVRLAEQPLTDRDLALSQFGFPTGWISDFASDYDYSVGMVARGSDDQISDLHAYLRSDEARLASREGDESRSWGAGTFRLFISHTHANRERAARLRDLLRRWDVDAFVAHEDIAPTREWENEIQVALRTCHAVCALITPDFAASKWCDQEVGFAVARGILVVPLKLGADPHGFIAKVQAVTPPAGSRPHEVASLVFEALALNPATAGAIAPAIVRRYATSESYEATREAFALLRTIQEGAWTEVMLEEVERAAGDNRQVGEANLPDGMRVSAAAAEIVQRVRANTATSVGVGDDDIPF